MKLSNSSISEGLSVDLPSGDSPNSPLPGTLEYLRQRLIKLREGRVPSPSPYKGKRKGQRKHPG